MKKKEDVVMKKFGKAIAWTAAAAMLLGLAGCGQGQTTVTDEGSGEMPKTLSIFCSMGNYTIKAGGKDNNDMLPFQLMEEMTGCHVEWTHPAGSAAEEKFNLLIASGNLPDMIVYSWSGVAGGAAMYAEDDVIIPLASLIDKYMPNLTAYNEEHPDVKKQYMDDSGEIYYIPFIRKDKELKVFQGPQIRQDWLEKLGLEMPKTPDELYEVLKAFKTRDPNGNGIADEIPMSGVKFEETAQAVDHLLWGFGTTNDFYVKDGKVAYGVLENEFEEGLGFITKLYSEELIDVDYLLNERDKMDNKVMNDKVGFVYSLQPGNYYNNMKDSGRKVVGTPHFAKTPGMNNVYDASYTQDATGTSIAVTTANKNAAGSLKWLDNFYGGKGMEYMNFGKEGVSFNWENDYPKLSDEYIFHNPNGKSQQEMCGLALGAYQSNFPTLQDWRYYEQILTSWGKESIETWSESAKTDGILPSLNFTAEENEEIAQKMSQIKTYVSEQLNKIVIGNSNISELAAIRSKIQSMGIEDVLAIYNRALERYNKR